MYKQLSLCFCCFVFAESEEQFMSACVLLYLKENTVKLEFFKEHIFEILQFVRKCMSI